MRILFALLAALSALLLAGCPRNGSNETVTSPAPAPRLNQDRSAGAFAQTDPWLLRTYDPNANRGNHGVFLGNGYLGVTLGADGGTESDSVCFVAGVYDENETLRPLPVLSPLQIVRDGPAPWAQPSANSGARGPANVQSLDLRYGVLSSTAGGYVASTFVSRADPYLIVQRGQNMGPSQAGGAAAPWPFPMRVGSVVVGAAFREGRDAGDYPGTTTRIVAVYTSRETADPQAAAEREAEAAAQAGYWTLERRHRVAWANHWKKHDIRIEGDPEAQQLVHKLMFDLLQSVRHSGDDSVPPETWSGDFYKGHIFWDAEVWMFPALLAQHPDLARNLLDYRFRHLDEARRRAKAQGFAGADFPWESAATGKEVAPGGFSTGRHVTAGVGWAHWQYWLATQDKAWLRARGWPVLSGVADYFASRATKNAQNGKWDIRGVFGPDELKGRVDNNTYTNALARYCLLAAGEAARIVGRPANPKWASVAANIALPYDKANDRYLARENDDGTKTKQADGELVLYPAALPMREQTAANTFDFHAARPIRNGPAMTASIHALLAARLGRADEAERYFRESYRPFVRGPFLLFSEKRSLDRCVFTTGAGGVLQSVLYGFGGLDWAQFDKIGGANDPYPVALPSSWKKLTITGIQRAGKRYTLTVTPQGRTLTRTK